MQYEVFAGRRYLCNIFPSDMEAEGIGPVEVLHQIDREMRCGTLTLVQVQNGNRETIASTEPDAADPFEDYEFDGGDFEE